jgi:3-dehydroquinate dehydratase-2
MGSMGLVRILIANGANLDLLGQREPHLYGTGKLSDLEAFLRGHLANVSALTGVKKVELTFFQSNSEADYLQEISSKWHGIIANPGAWTHTSLAIADRLTAVGVPYVEVHISNIFAREDFRKHSYISAHAAGIVTGLGFDSYLCGLIGLLSRLKATQAGSEKID